MRVQVKSLSLAAAAAAVIMFSGCRFFDGGKTADDVDSQWITLFNGKNLDGWIPKFTGYGLGVNYGNTFQAQKGVLKVVYDQYDTFDRQFGHLFYKTPYSHYRMRLEYRFLGEQTPGGPDWAYRNSGIMIHCQDPTTMRKDQEFPVCIEVQLLGGDGKTPRTTGNLCTPGTHVVMKGVLEKRHCIMSSSPTYHGDQWVTAEIEVNGGRVIRHYINGQPVLEYEQPHLDETEPDAQKLLKAGSPPLVTGGFIALQAESHPCEFRRVELLPLDAGSAQ